MNKLSSKDMKIDPGLQNPLTRGFFRSNHRQSDRLIRTHAPIAGIFGKKTNPNNQESYVGKFTENGCYPCIAASTYPI